MGQTDYVTGYDFWRVDRHYSCAAWKMENDYQPFHFKETADVNENQDVESNNDINI